MNLFSAFAHYLTIFRNKNHSLENPFQLGCSLGLVNFEPCLVGTHHLWTRIALAIHAKTMVDPLKRLKGRGLVDGSLSKKAEVEGRTQIWSNATIVLPLMPVTNVPKLKSFT